MKVLIEFDNPTETRRYKIGIIPFLKVLGKTTTTEEIEVAVKQIMSQNLAENTNE